MKTADLSSFCFLKPLPEEDLFTILRSDRIHRVIHYCLGPAGTNIAKAAGLWTNRAGLWDKTLICLTKTPEEALALAKNHAGTSSVAFYWSCAVYFQEAELFFANPDAVTFYAAESMPLDSMSLAARPEKAAVIKAANGIIEATFRIGSHPSPSHLVQNRGIKIVPCLSNADAAVRCSNGEFELCITTRTAAGSSRLEILHDFGSPEMVFFAGLPTERAEFLAALAQDKTDGWRDSVKTGSMEVIP